MAKKLQRRVVRKTSSPSPGGGEGRRPKARRSRRISDQAVTDFTIQLATLSSSGIPMVRALGILEGQTKPGPFKDVLAELVEDVSSGTPLSEAMGKHEGVFDQLYASMVNAGEVGGVLSTLR